jgi:hypothetical protein
VGPGRREHLAAAHAGLRRAVTVPTQVVHYACRTISPALTLHRKAALAPGALAAPQLGRKGRVVMTFAPHRDWDQLQQLGRADQRRVPGPERLAHIPARAAHIPARAAHIPARAAHIPARAAHIPAPAAHIKRHVTSGHPVKLTNHVERGIAAIEKSADIWWFEPSSESRQTMGRHRRPSAHPHARGALVCVALAVGAICIALVSAGHAEAKTYDGVGSPGDPLSASQIGSVVVSVGGSSTAPTAYAATTTPRLSF